MLVAPPPPCTHAAARAAILASPALISLGPTIRNGGGVDTLICQDLTGDGVRDFAAAIFSGGTAGDTAWVVFRADGSRWRLAFRNLHAYKIGLFRSGRDLIESQPIYKKNDPNCCPSGGFDHRRYRWVAGRFKLVRSWHNSRFKP
jgi:hypothetical protein